MPSTDPGRDSAPSILDELRKRRVLRVAGAYVLVAWVLMQAGEIVFPAFELSNSALRALILGLGAGLPLVIVLAWLLDVTPSGIRIYRRATGRDSNGAQSAADGAAEEADGLARSLEMLLLGVFVPVFAFLIVVAFLKFGPSSVPSPALPVSGVPSIAVLPFEDVSLGADDKGFFARGMHEDVLTQLTRIPGLKLISRTSVLPFAARDKPMQQIGRELGVAHVLDGSVRRTKSQVRVSAQLIRAETNEQLWAQNFDADLKDVFEVQTRIAKAIATALEAQLVSVSPASGRSVDPGAYDAYLKARDLHRDLEPGDFAALERARRLYEQAVERDPSLSSAWLELARLHCEAYWFGLDRSDKRARLARRSLDRAAEQGMGAGRIALGEGIFAYYVEHDYESALSRFAEATERVPSNAEAHFYRAMILRRLGQLDGALDAHAESIRLDPLNYAYQEEYVLTLMFAGKLDGALQRNRDLLRRDPHRERVRLQQWQLVLELQGAPDALLDQILAVPRSSWSQQSYSMLELVALLAGRPEAALEVLESDPAPNPDSGYRDYQIAVLADALGRKEESARRLAASEDKFERFLELWPDSASEALLNRTGALFAASKGEWERAVELQRRNVEAMPIDQDLIVGLPALWRLAELELEAGRTELARDTLERVGAKVALGSILFGGHFVLARHPAFEQARREPGLRAYLEEIRPDYAARWDR